MASPSALVMSVETIHKLCMTTLTACGASSLHAKAIADNLSAAERDGCKSHGLFRLPAFLKGCKCPRGIVCATLSVLCCVDGSKKKANCPTCVRVAAWRSLSRPRRASGRQSRPRS